MRLTTLLVLLLGSLLSACNSSSPDAPDSVEKPTVLPSGFLPLGTFQAIVNSGSAMGSYPHPTVLNGNALYVPAGEEGGVLVIDVSDVEKPRVARHLGGYDAQAVAVDGNRMALVEREVLHVLDSSDPMHPEWLGKLQLTTGGEFPVTGVAVNGNTVLVGGGGYYIGSNSALTAIDITDAAHPVVRDAVPESGTAALAIAGTHAFAASYESGLRVFDFSDTSDLALLAELDLGFSATQLQVVGNRLYIGGPATDFSGYDFDFAIIDISTPANPRLISQVRLNQGGWPGFFNGFRGLHVAGSHAYLAFADNGALVIDLSDERSPAYEGKLGPKEFVGGVSFKDDHLLLASRSGIFTVPSKSRGLFPPPAVDFPETFGTLVSSNTATDSIYLGNIDDAGGHYPRAPQWRGDNIFLPIGSGVDSLFVLAASPASAPELLATSSVGGNDLAFSGDVMYSVNGLDLRISDVSDPVHISLLQTVNAYTGWPMSPAALAIQGNHLYVAGAGPSTAGARTLQVLDISDPLAPQLRGHVDGCFANDISVQGNHAYVAGREHGLCIYDISDPDQPVLVSHSGSTGFASAIEIAGSLAYVRNAGRFGDSLAIFDITDPASPVLKGLVTLSDVMSAGYGNLGFAVLDGRAYVGMWSQVAVVDITDPATPALLGELSGSDLYNSGVGVHDGYVYVASRYGLKVWQP